MKLKYGDMFKHLEDCDAVFVTTNDVIKRDGSLVMGAGAALRMTYDFPDAPKTFGQALLQTTSDPYGVLWTTTIYSHREIDIGIFQTKRHFKDASDLGLVEYSTACLKSYADKFPEYNIYLNYPGIGRGGLSDRDVYPIIKTLPNNVFVWRM